MALQLLVSASNDRVRLYLDVNTQDFVTGLRFENDLGIPVTVEVRRPSGSVYSQVRTASLTTFAVPTNRRFRYSDDLTSDWGVSLSADWP